MHLTLKTKILGILIFFVIVFLSLTGFIYFQVSDIENLHNDMLDSSNIEASQAGEISGKINVIFNYLYAFAVISVVFAALLYIYFVRAFLSPLEWLHYEIDLLAKGDLSSDSITEVDAKTEIDMMGNSIYKMLKNIRHIIKDINKKTQALLASAQQLASHAQQTSAGSSETASTINEISSTIEKVAGNTQYVSAESQKAVDRANKGNEDITRLQNQMNDINTSTQNIYHVINKLSYKSNEITQIVELITHIADQTNLLALNAAIEAARAGEQGKGFAVVAEEVRQLAEQSGGAAKNIHKLIIEIQEEAQNAVKVSEQDSQLVEEGAKLMQKVSESFHGIIEAIHNLNEQVEEIAAAAEEISASIQSVSGTAEEQNAAMEEVSAASDSLTKMALELRELEQRFKL